MHPEKPGSGRVFLCAEFLVLFGLVPLLVLSLRQPGILVLVLWGGGFACWAASRAAPQGKALGIQRVLARFALCGAALTLATWALAPALFLSLPLQHPRFWALVMLLYPLLSVWPQEIIFRRFLFHRYGLLFGNRITAASAIAFSYAHIIYLNPLAVVLTLAGGAMFARSYSKTRSLTLTALEHALYGCLVFTIGLGRYFFSGAAWHH
ncbi:MAG TPA: CPBP family intramembrane glutamic endopeptidase [Acidocella sp.]|nr:CPBP family intramembrane glutamic endopeptidase [Acidocella sp.]